jgi:hypothetical protein
MMYASQYKNGSGSYLLVQLKDGRFEFSFATGFSNIITVRYVGSKSLTGSLSIYWYLLYYSTLSHFIAIQVSISYHIE